MVAIRVVLFPSQREKTQVLLAGSVQGAVGCSNVRRWDWGHVKWHGDARIESWPVNFRPGSPTTTWG